MTIRTTLACLVTLLGVSCQTDDLSSTTRSIEGNDLVALERAAIREHLASNSRALDELELALDRELRSGYATQLATHSDYQRVARTALVHWARLLRRRLDEALHTRVPELADDPACAGSVIGDAVLLDYADATLGNGERTRGVVAALQGLGRHLACLGGTQTEKLATNMVIAFDDVRTALQIDGQAGAIPYVVQAFAAPMLIVHDVERHRGANAPLARWFAEHEAILVDGATTRHLPASWQGLWLYDRMTGRMRGFRADRDARDEKAIDLVALVRTVARPSPGDAACSLAEMVQRGSANGRYLCLGKLCTNSEDPTCLSPGAGDAPPAKGAVNLPGLATASPLDCITAQAVSPQREQMTCILEATGLQSSPGKLAVKDLTQVTLAGVKVTPGCMLNQTTGTQYDKDMKAAQDAYNAAVEAAKAQFEADKKLALTNIDDLTNSLAWSQARLETARTEARNDPNDVYKSWVQAFWEADVKECTADLNTAIDELAADIRSYAATREAALKTAEEKKQKDEAAARAAAGFKCVEGTTCGNGCSAIATMTAKLNECLSERADPAKSDPLAGPGGCGLACDPIDPTDRGTGRTCITDLETVKFSPRSETCWAVRCGPSDHGGASACCGSGGITSDGGPELVGLCGATDCGEGSPTIVGGRCECGGDGAVGGVIPGGPPPTIPLF